MGEAEALRARLRHVYWIGGASGAGKSTTARHLAAEHGLRVYATDAVMPDHAARSGRDAPFLARFAAMDLDERWVNRTPETMLETFHWYHGEGFGLIVEDLASGPSDPPVVAEGFRLLPHLVKPLLAVRERAVWLLPTPEFRRAAFARRDFGSRTSDPRRALENLLERDRMFTERLAAELGRLDLPVIEVAEDAPDGWVATEVAERFGL